MTGEDDGTPGVPRNPPGEQAHRAGHAAPFGVHQHHRTGHFALLVTSLARDPANAWLGPGGSVAAGHAEPAFFCAVSPDGRVCVRACGDLPTSALPSGRCGNAGGGGKRWLASTGRSCHEPWAAACQGARGPARRGAAAGRAAAPRPCAGLLDSAAADHQTASSAAWLHDAQAALVAPFWMSSCSQLDCDVEERSRALTRPGLRRVLDGLRLTLRWTGRGPVGRIIGIGF
jgi:hypothetical protein